MPKICLKICFLTQHLHHHRNCLFLIISLLLILNECSTLYAHTNKEQSIETNKYKLAQKRLWLQSLLNESRHKRSVIETFSNADSAYKRPCPVDCNCNYETISCSQIIKSCAECIYWNEIDFNQINSIQPGAFKDFKFASGKKTHIVIYKLINSTLEAGVFKDMIIPENAQIEITFQYNSVIKFSKNVLNGLRVGSNSTLVFNFPYTTQVVFVSKCFDGVDMKDKNSRLIFRVLKSFSVRFVNDFIIQGFIDYKEKVQRLAMLNNATINTVKKSLSIPNPELNINKANSSWLLNNGQLIIDIKSTHLVKFEDYSMAYLNINPGVKMYLDLDLIEKLMIQRHSFSNMNLGSKSKFTIYGRHLTFIDFRANSFSSINLESNSHFQMYLEELLHSLCLQRNVFDKLTLNAHAHFNFSVINSKNVMLMHDSFSNLNLNSLSSKLYIGVYNKPSFQLGLKNNNYYQEFLKERTFYKWTTNFGIGEQGSIDRYTGLYQPPFSLSSDFFYAGIESEKNKYDLKNYYTIHKQAYAYNLSIEKDCFSNADSKFMGKSENVWIVADNINTLLVDDMVVSNDKTNMKNLNFLINVKNVVLSPKSFNNLNGIKMEFLREPEIINFNISDKLLGDFVQTIKLIGLNLNKRYDRFLGPEQDDLDMEGFKIETMVDDYCKLSKLSPNIVINIEPRFIDEQSELCSCESLYLQMNQISKYNGIDSSMFNCKIGESTIPICQQRLERTCESKQFAVDHQSQTNFVKFWEYCISEEDQEEMTDKVNGNKNSGNYYLNNFNDPDGMFSASLSTSSSFFEKSDSFQNSLSQPGGNDAIPEVYDEHDASISSNITSIGKIVGLIVVLFLAGIILFMIIINIIQYKFRNELLDDLEYQNGPSSSYNQSQTKEILNSEDNQQYQRPNGTSGQKFWKKTFSANSLKRTLSIASLRSKRELNKNTSETTKNKDFSLELDESSSDDEEYIKNRRLRNQQKESDSFFDDDYDEEISEDSDDTYESKYSRNLNKQKYAEAIKLKKSSYNDKFIKSKGYVYTDVTDSGNPSEINSSPVNSNRTVLTPPPPYQIT